MRSALLVPLEADAVCIGGTRAAIAHWIAIFVSRDHYHFERVRT